MCLDIFANQFIHVYLKEGCPIPLPCTKWKIHKIGETKKWEFVFMDKQVLFQDLMAELEKLSKKPTNHLNPIYYDTPTPEKAKGEFKVIEDEDDSISLAIAR
jgi:hypothetical protein